MAGEIVYADLRHRGDGSPAEKRPAPAPCPRWHNVLLKLSGLGHLILLVLVVVLSIRVFQGSTSVPRQSDEEGTGGGTRGRNRTERCVISSLMRYLCENPTACAGYKLCPQDWQLHEDRCYRLSKEIRKWDQSKTDCENQDSQLVVLRDEKEKEYIKNLTGGSTQPVWIGLSSLQKEWRWVDNTTFDTKKFGILPGVGCGTLKKKELENDGCDSEHKWVCQKNSFQLSLAMAEDDERCTGAV